MKNTREFYLGNPNLPTNKALFEWTPKMVAELKKCKKDLLYFAENFFHIINLDHGRQKIKLHKCQKRVLKKMTRDRFFILLASRQVGKTTLMTIYTLWHACFNDDQRILVVANKEDTAKEIFSRIRMAYEELPNYLKPGVVEYGKESMKLTNGSVIGISTTTGTAARGQSINLMLLDELAFIEPHIVDAFWKSVFPVISSSKKSKIFIASTANGTDNLFYRTWSGAIEHRNGWGFDKITWDEIPGRDAMWKYDTIRAIGSEEAFNQEFGCQFITSSDAAINDDLFESLKINCYRPKVVLDDEAYKIWKQPDDGGIYVAGVDVAEGINQNASCIQILDLRDLSNIEQVATYWSKTIEPYNFTTKLHEVLLHWGSPPVLIERNNCGGQVVDQLYKTLRYFNVVNYDIGNKRNNRLGVVVHTNSKYRCISNMRYYINELRAVNIRDLNTLSEIKTFTKLPNNKWAATPGNLDDRVMSLGWALLILDNDLTKKFFEVVEYDDNNRPLKLRKYDFDYGTKVGKNLYGWGDEDEDSHVDTIVFNEKNNDPYSNSELDWMMENGWTKATEFTTQRSYTPAANSWLV